MTASYQRVEAVYNGSNGDDTKQLYVELSMLGPAGELVVNLFRANKNSVRAKKYKRRSSTGAAYQTKQWAIENIERLLKRHATALGIVWGWKGDPAQARHRWVIYVELPTGQVSFHTGDRGDGPSFPGEWCGEFASADRIIALAAHLIDGTPAAHVGPPAMPYVDEHPKRARAPAMPGDDEPGLPL